MILAGERERVCAFINDAVKDGDPITEKYEALGALDAAGNLIGGFVYYNHERRADGGNVFVAVAGCGNWLTRENLNIWFRYPFIQLGCNRITAMVAKSNRKSRTLVERLGAKREGCVRGARGPGRDSIIYGMIREDCRWIR